MKQSENAGPHASAETICRGAAAGSCAVHSVGTVYFAELNAPLDFGTELMTPQIASSIGGPLPRAAWYTRG